MREYLFAFLIIIYLVCLEMVVYGMQLTSFNLAKKETFERKKPVKKDKYTLLLTDPPTVFMVYNSFPLQDNKKDDVLVRYDDQNFYITVHNKEWKVLINNHNEVLLHNKINKSVIQLAPLILERKEKDCIIISNELLNDKKCKKNAFSSKNNESYRSTKNASYRYSFFSKIKNHPLKAIFIGASVGMFGYFATKKLGTIFLDQAARILQSSLINAPIDFFDDMSTFSLVR